MLGGRCTCESTDGDGDVGARRTSAPPPEPRSCSMPPAANEVLLTTLPPAPSQLPARPPMNGEPGRCSGNGSEPAAAAAGGGGAGRPAAGRCDGSATSPRVGVGAYSTGTGSSGADRAADGGGNAGGGGGGASLGNTSDEMC